ncbi:hypothetical protein FBZ93_101858 [Bradyrhizobium macuxiense]|uniref:Uncharacterized protein n=1 Tax=Bradyrhizobium macuxiense TaxID=1755647 RepID=A0A560MJL7_9BRAD|nr:hypothetical protein [Bradyrhizobium macuxiense]TWC07565.1 hypothetical protein FBZ93_101858 [Bradyrhizobium macuxiense]
MRFNLAILSVLAARPEQRIPLDEVSREVKRMIAAGDAATKLKRSSELGDADVFQSGWASINETGLQITEPGLALWRSLEASRVEQELAEQEIAEQKLGEQELGEPRVERSEIAAADTRDAIGDAVVEQPDDIARQLPRLMEELAGRATSNASRSTAAPDLPARAPIVPEPAFGSIHPADRNDARLSQLAGWLGARMPKLRRARKRRSADDGRDRRSESRGGMTGLAVACLSLISVVACVAAAIALGQISTLKSDNAALRRELVPLRDRLAKLEQDAAKREAAEQNAAQDKAEAEKAADAASEQAALNLSREEIQLIREYIKAAPSAGAGAPAVNVGDPITGGMIPLPSALTQKVPRLVGARFATRSGTIIISTRNSRRVDAVLMPN